MGEKKALFIEGVRSREQPKWRELLIVLFLFTIFLVLLIAITKQLTRDIHLRRAGIFVEGTATAFEAERGWYGVRYTFSNGNVSYEGLSAVRQAWMESVKLPQRVRVQFLSNNPAISWAPDVAENQLWWEFLGVVFFSASVIVLGVVGAVTLNDFWYGWRFRQSGLRQLQLPAYPKGWH